MDVGNSDSRAEDVRFAEMLAGAVLEDWRAGMEDTSIAGRVVGSTLAVRVVTAGTGEIIFSRNFSV